MSESWVSEVQAYFTWIGLRRALTIHANELTIAQKMPYGCCHVVCSSDSYQRGKSGDAYPEDGVALHLVKKEGHWWKQFSGLSTAK
jgi:hypothetical protein